MTAIMMAIRFGQLARHAPSGQVVRYLVVGAWNTLFGYGMYALLNFLLAPLLNEYLAAMAASVLANVIAISVAFLGYKLWVFRTKGNFLREYLRCYLVYGSTLRRAGAAAAADPRAESVYHSADGGPLSGWCHPDGRNGRG